MGIFNTKKEKKNDNPDLNNNIQEPAKFYSSCIEVLHNEAKENGFANKGVIFIPELIPIGEKTVLTFLKDSAFRMMFGDNPTKYYYVIMSLSLQAGIVFASKWHYDYSELKNGYVETILDEGPADEATPILKDELGINSMQEQNEFYRKIFDKWLKLHAPYWNLEDCRQYTFRSILAAYQVGVSMILEKYGY